MADRPEVWEHSMQRFMRPYLGNVLEPVNRRGALIELIGWKLLTGEGGVTFDSWVAKFTEILEEFAIHPKGKAGQSMLKEIVKNTRDDLYGDYNVWVCCGNCGEPFHQPASLKTANRILVGVDVCETCFAQGGCIDPQFPIEQSEDDEQDEHAWLLASPLSDDDVDEDDHEGDLSEGSGEPTGDKPHISPEEAEEANEYLRKLMED